MMHSTRVHSVFAHRYDVSFQSEPIRHSELHPRFTPFAPQRLHLTAFPFMENPAERMFHTSITEARKYTDVFKFMDDDYSAVETFLRKTFKTKRPISASDIADALGMDYGNVREVLARMIREGKLGVK